MGALWADWKSKSSFWSVVFLLYTATTHHFPVRLWYVTKRRFYMTTGNDQLSGWTKKLQSNSQSQTCTKTGHGHCFVICCPSDPLQLSKSWLNHYSWEVCSANGWDAPKTVMPAAAIGQQKGPSSPRQCPHMSYNQCFKSWMNWAAKFCLICHFHLPFHQLTTTSSSSSTTFAGKIQQPVGHRKCFPMVHRIPEHRFLCYRNKLISCLQKRVDCNGSYFN